MYLAETLCDMGAMVEDKNNSRIESDGDDDSVRKDGSDMDVDDCVFHDAGI